MADQAEIRDIASLELAKTIANLRLEGEDDGHDDGTTVEWDARDICETLAHLIERAREITGTPGFPPQPAVDA